MNIDKPEEFVETITFAEGIDSQDKGSGKAMTYSDKYALMKSYKISTGEDVDEGTDEETLENEDFDISNESTLGKVKIDFRDMDLRLWKEELKYKKTAGKCPCCFFVYSAALRCSLLLKRIEILYDG